MLAVIAFMRFPSALLALLLSTPVLGAAESLQVYVCESGQAGVREYFKKDVPSYQSLVRSGNAFWSDGRIDSNTALAIFEGAGIWGMTTPSDWFSRMHTKTPAKVLAAIALAESGRDGFPWPWTINFQGKSFFYETKEQAIGAARKLLQSGSTLFDVGLMQVNWHFHGRKFASVSDAFDPISNIKVADSILQEQLKLEGSIEEAIGRYHSKTPSRKNSYLQKVISQMDRLANSPPKPKQLPRC